MDEAGAETSVSVPPEPLVPRGRVLVVTAEPEVTDAVHGVLDDAYDVIAYDDPRDALLGIVRGDEYDIVLCDVVMPFVCAGEFRDQVAVMNQALAERVVMIPFGANEPGTYDPDVAKLLDVPQLKARVAELVSLRTMPPRSR